MATVLTGIRASSVRSCARKACFEAENAPARERSRKEDMQLARGKIIAAVYANDLKKRLGPENVETEVEVHWPLGVGHIDIQVGTEAIEVVSSRNPSGDYIESKLRQLTLYMTWGEDIETGRLVIVDPDLFDEDVIRLEKHSDLYQRLLAEINERIDAIGAYQDGGPLPARVCSKPEEARQHFCLFAAHCFNGWQPEPVEEIDSPAVREITSRWWQRKQAEKGARAMLTAAEADRKAVEEELAEHVPVGDWQVGPLKVTRTHVQRGPTVDMRKVLAAGFPVPDEFLRPGAAYDTFRCERTSDGPAVTADDFGDRPPF